MEKPGLCVPFREIADRLPVGLLFAAPDGRIIYCNAVEAKAHGISPERMLGRSVVDCHPPEKQARIRELLDAVAAPDHPGRFRTNERHGKFEEQWLSSVYDDDGRLLGLMLVNVDVTDRETSRRQWQVQATRDELTGLFNKNHFFTVFAALQAQLGREMPSLSLMMADLNGLKNVNDQQGHLAGDQLIAGAGLVLRRSMRVTDLVFRFGGDEFLVLQPGADEAVAAATFRRVKVGCRRWAASHPGLPLSLALGWQIARTPQEADQALTLADAAMYRDKQREKARLARRT